MNRRPDSQGDSYIPQNFVCMCGAGEGLNNNLWFKMHLLDELPCCNVWFFFSTNCYLVISLVKVGDPCIILKLKWRNCSKWQVHEQLAFISKSNSALESVATKYAFCSIPVYSANTIFSANHERSFLSTSHEVYFWRSGSTFLWILVLHLTPDQFSNDKIWIFQSWKKLELQMLCVC